MCLQCGKAGGHGNLVWRKFRSVEKQNVFRELVDAIGSTNIQFLGLKERPGISMH